MNRIALSAAALIALSGCTVARVSPLDQRTMMISGRGSAYTTSADVMKKVFTTAAAEAQKRGYPYFTILDAADRSRETQYTSPAQASGSYASSVSCGAYTCAGGGVGSYSYTGPQTVNFFKPGSDVVIRFLTEAVAQGHQNVWNAASVLAANHD